MQIALSAESFRFMDTPMGLRGYSPRDGRNILISGLKGSEWRPAIVSIALTDACNKGCPFCYASSHPEGESHWTYQELLSLVKDLDRNGIFAVAFGGGEPLLWKDRETKKDLYHLVEDLSGQTSLSLSFTTNGLGIEPLRLKNSRAVVRLSLHSPREVGRIIKTAQTLRLNGIQVGINILWQRSSILPTVKAVKRLAAAGFRDIIHLPLKLHGRARKMQEEAPGKAEMASALYLTGLKSARLSSCELLPLLRVGDLGCGAGDLFVHLSPQKMVKACSMTDEGISLKEISYQGLLEAYRQIKKPECYREHKPQPNSLAIWPGVPSNHSMDTTFYLLDSKGYLAEFDTCENGAVPRDAASDKTIDEFRFLQKLLKDEKIAKAYLTKGFENLTDAFIIVKGRENLPPSISSEAIRVKFRCENQAYFIIDSGDCTKEEQEMMAKSSRFSKMPSFFRGPFSYAYSHDEDSPNGALYIKDGRPQIIASLKGLTSIPQVHTNWARTYKIDLSKILDDLCYY